MSRVEIEGLTKRFEGKPPTIAVDDLSLEIEQGEFLVLLGPSGCGKTTTLRCLAGLESANEGVLTFGGEKVFDSSSKLNLSPDKRSIGMVFQSYALWPHMTVRKNIAYPLKARKMRQGISAGWVEEMADVVDCGELLDRYPGQLSGGQQQRVALARGLVARPDLVLFDEPLSNLDARLREQVRNELAELHNRLDFTAVYVTHDQSEALALGDRLAIMRKGRIEQLGTPREVFASPASEYVAGFIGMGNRFEMIERDGEWWLAGGKVTGRLPAGRNQVVLRLRSDDLDVRPAGTVAAEHEVGFDAEVVVVSFGGRHVDVVLKIGESRIDAQITSPPADLAPGDRVLAVFDPSKAAMYDEDGALVARGAERPAAIAASAG
ncbi:ABC transporter ATP-binding protein [Desertimonas flava]|uniref:ABC transporter ATP-binding protein n=1 Tax=Desertimonas flava TaxID=2064846 RepID=UPI000E34D623|nr:ABC transporter ATP-binding protein [Desertimonas flava]